MNRHLIRWLVVLCAMAVGSGCTLRGAYNHSDRFASRYIESLVTLESPQEDALESKLEETLSWHRSTQIPRYSSFLRDLATQITEPAPIEKYRTNLKVVQSFGQEMARHSAADATQFLRSLNPDQRAELFASLEKNAAKSQRRYAKRTGKYSAEELAEARAKSLRKGIARLTGTLSDAQEQLITTTGRALVAVQPEMQENARVFRERLRGALENSDPAAQAQAEQLLLDPTAFRIPAYTEKLATNREKILELLAALDQTLTSEQRQAARKRFTSLAEELDSLSPRS
jgi:hypothetical protein